MTGTNWRRENKRAKIPRESITSVGTHTRKTQHRGARSLTFLRPFVVPFFLRVAALFLSISAHSERVFFDLVVPFFLRVATFFLSISAFSKLSIAERPTCHADVAAAAASFCAAERPACHADTAVFFGLNEQNTADVLTNKLSMTICLVSY
jgi:glyoxylate carboligase